MKTLTTLQCYLVFLCCLLLLAGGLASGCAKSSPKSNHADHHSGHHTIASTSALGENEKAEATLLTNNLQLTFAGTRSGEGYFPYDSSSLMIFQSERIPENPFYQMYLFDRESGGIKQVSTGKGKTTCGWIHPDKKRVLFSSTHLDPNTDKLQQEELELRASGKERRYSWDYDPHYDIFEAPLESSHSPTKLKRLTTALGYDAEASWSPDGKTLLFASNSHAYSQNLTVEEKANLETDPSSFIDIYAIDTVSGKQRRLTTSPGYDGGPFYSADGKLITWRRFSADGATAEIYVMNADGSKQRQVTNLGVMSWAPFFHPSGEYIVFATNIHGFANFELYLVRTDGQGAPLRVTHSEGFDGLPVFTPDGNQLSWTAKRSFNKTSQIFIADWNDFNARKALGLHPLSAWAITTASAYPELRKALELPPLGVSARAISRDLLTLAAPEMEGRMTGSEGELKATAYAAEELKKAGLKPAGDKGTYFQSFTFTAGVLLGEHNNLSIAGAVDQQAALDSDWRPLAFSAVGKMPAKAVVFAGYGIVAPEHRAEDGTAYPEYDSFVHLDLKDKWLLVLRDSPDDVEQELRSNLLRHASARYKAMLARDRGAVGIIFVRGPHSTAKSELVELSFDAALAGTSIAVLSISDKLAADLLSASGKSLPDLAKKLNNGQPVMGFELPGIKVSAQVDIVQQKRSGRNVLALLPATKASTNSSTVVIGAHIDHLGRGWSNGSLSESRQEEQIHFGADDNASGVSAALEVARQLAAKTRSGSLVTTQNLLIGLWSGEELGLIGSSHFVNNFGGKKRDQLSPEITAYLNMDMVGRLNEKLVIQGVASSSDWLRLIEQGNYKSALPLVLQNDTYLPTDATAFYLKKVPILSLFTGVHRDYHTPRDTADKINYSGIARVVELVTGVSSRILATNVAPKYQSVEKPDHFGQRAVLRAYLGTIPDYADTSITGVRIAGVATGGPAEDAGLKGQDVIVRLNGKKIENIYDYTFAIETLKVGVTTKITVQRDGKELTLEITPQSRQ